MNEQSKIKVDNRFWLNGNFAPVHEEITETRLEVTGAIPPELNGRYFRNGANPPNGDTPHWFFGHGMIHGVELNKGKANWYRNRYVKTPLLNASDEDLADAMQDLTKSIANTHIMGHAGKIFALEEGHWPFELSKNLETVGAYNFGGKLKTGMTAHPKVCGETGELLFFGYGIVPPYLTYHRASAEGELLQSEEIEVKGATMVHDFNITRNHVIFMDLPLIWDFEAAEKYGMPIRWSDEYGARLGVMPRDGSNKDVVWYDIDPCYVYHPMNAYERDGKIIIDVCRMSHSMKEGAPDVLPVLYQWSIDLREGKVSERQLDDHGVDFPRVPDRLVGQPYRYGYTAEFSGLPAAAAFRKYDMKTGTSTAHVLQNGRTGGEAVFVPADGASAEDDGYLLSFVHDPSIDKSELVILDASQVEKDPVARIHLPVRVPAGFHGSWIAD